MELYTEKIPNVAACFEAKPGVYYVKDLKHQAPTLINEAEKLGIKIYKGTAKRKTAKSEWIKIFTFGIRTPITLYIEFSNGVKLYNYTMFDKDEDPDPNEAMEVCKILSTYNYPLTGCKLLKDSWLKTSVKNIPYELTSLEKEAHFMLSMALRGGANCVLDYDKIDFETHVDYHQLYAYVMTTHTFPQGMAKGVDGYEPHEFGIYHIAEGRARLKKNGYALLSVIGLDTKMAGADGEWFDLATTIGCICDPDLTLLFENYEVEDLAIDYTIYYTYSFDGSSHFGPIAKQIYEGRMNSTGAKKRFYKLMNEYLAGYFERTSNIGCWWSSMTAQPKIDKPYRYNPSVGIFILAYARRLLNSLLHMFPKSKVAGYDTDCVFFKGKPEEISKKVMQKFGDAMGQLHFDGIYKDVIHKASKHYFGFDLEANEPFKKQSGQSKSGYGWRFDRERGEYIYEKR